IPSELLQSIEVSKALTPDQDGDSIGGSVNLVMKHAPEKFRGFGSIGGGYNQMLKDWSQSNFSGTVGRRFDSGKLGLILSGSRSQRTRGNHRMEVTYTPTLGFKGLSRRGYQGSGARGGARGAMANKQSATSFFPVRGLFTRFIDDPENRQRLRLAVGNSRID